MATLKCLACGHDNSVGDESCSSCSSSLNLKLCSACEAINAHDAARCHSCNAEFGIEAPRSEPLEADAQAADVTAPEASDATAPEAPHVEKALPVAWRMAAEQSRKRSARFTAAALWILPLLGFGLGYYVYGAFHVGQNSQSAPTTEAARESQPARRPEPNPKEVSKPQSAELGQAQAVTGKIAPVVRTTPAPIVKTTAPSEPRRTTAPVTHTRAAGEATKTTPAGLPVATTALPATSATVLPVSEPAEAAPGPRIVSVTHTGSALANEAQAVPAEAQTLPAPAAAAVGPSVATKTRSDDEPAGCAAAVAALGLCKSK